MEAMRQSDTPSSPSFPVLEPLILDADMENMYGDTDMEFFDPSVLNDSSQPPDRDSENFLAERSGNRAIADSLTSIAPSQLGVKQQSYRETNPTKHNPNPPLSESLSDSPGDSSGSGSSTTSGNHLRQTSFNSNVSGSFGESPTFAKQYPPGWSGTGEPLFGLDTDTDMNTLPDGFSIGADIESSNKAMDSAFDFDGAASSPNPLKSESSPPAESDTISPRMRASNASKAPNQASHTKSSVCLPVYFIM